MNAIAWISGYRSSGYTGWNLRQYTELYVGNPHMVAYIFCSDANTLPGAIKLKFKFRPRGRGRERRTSKPQTVLKKEKRGARDPSKLKFEATQRRYTNVNVYHGPLLVPPPLLHPLLSVLVGKEDGEK
ncbi:hypothetical protein EV361DRAFT_874265 [Lentinula raphanica]|nr:hypothetical protein EV361DRAFT_874265 [Lentinula raphanica]